MNKLKFIQIILISLISFQSAITQNFSVEWIKSSEGPGWEFVSDMMFDQEGNTYLIGNYNGTSKIGDNISEGDEDIFIICYNKEGELQWKNTINNSGYCYISSIVPTSDNNFYITGFFRGEINIGTFGLNAGNKINAFVSKIDRLGQAGWVKQIDGEFKGNKLLIQPTKKDQILWASSFEGNLVINDSTFHSIPGTSDIVIALLDKKGDIKNFTLIQGTGDDCINDLTCDENGNIYLAASFEKELKIKEFTLKSAGRSDGAVIVMDDALQPITIRQIGSIYQDKAECIALDENHNLIVTGFYSGEIKLDDILLPPPTGKQDVFICKFNQVGKLIWADGFGGRANEFTSSLAINRNNSIYISGNFRGEIEKNDQKVNSSGFSNDLFIAKYYPNGKMKFIEAIGDTITDFSRKLRIDKENYIYLTGNWNKTIKTNEDTTLNDLADDFFLTKLYDCDFSDKIILGNDTCLCGDSFTIKADTSFKEYNWNDGSAGYIKTVDTTGLYSVTAINDHNCTSTDSIYVKINPLPVFDLGDTIYAKKGEIITLYGPPGMKNYQWSDGSNLLFLEIDTDSLELGINNFNLELTDKNGCGSNSLISISVFDSSEFLMYNKIHNHDEELYINISPNPTNNFINLKMENLKLHSEVEMKLLSLNGETFVSETFNTNSDYFHYKINVENLAKGVYILNIVNDIYFIYRKIIIY